MGIKIGSPAPEAAVASLPSIPCASAGSSARSDTLNKMEKYEAERILRDRERAPERRFARMSYNAAAWTKAHWMAPLLLPSSSFG